MAWNIVLVHDGGIDVSGWDGIYEVLRTDGFKVSIVQLGAASFDGDVALTELALGLQDRPTILVGHGYGGEVISELADDPRVAAIVYLADVEAGVTASIEAIYAELRTASVRALHHSAI